MTKDEALCHMTTAANDKMDQMELIAGRVSAINECFY